MVANEKGFRRLNRLMTEHNVSKRALEQFIEHRSSEGYGVRRLGSIGESSTYKVVHTSTISVRPGVKQSTSLVVISEITGKPIEASKPNRCWEQLYHELLTDLQER